MGKPFTCPGCGAVHNPDTCESKFTGEQEGAPPPPPGAAPPAASPPPTTAPPAGAVPVMPPDETDELFAPWKET